MKCRLIAMDFDGTLLTSNKQITPVTKQALLKYKKQDYVIVGVTARNLESVKNVADINMFDYLILNNGSYIYDVKNDSGKYKKMISKEEYYRITDELKDFCTRIDYCSALSYFYYKEKSTDNRPFIKNIDDMEEIDEEIARLNIHLSEAEKMEYYRDLINNKYENLNCFIMQDSDNNISKWLVINPKGINKATVLKELGQELKIDLNEMLFFGDGPNDLEVMQSVGHSIAMGNALDQIKKQAKYITLSNDENGIAVFLDKFLIDKNN